MHESTCRLTVLLAGTLAAAGAAQDPAAKDQPAKATEWPPLKSDEQERVMNQLVQFRKEPQFHADAQKALVEIGPAAVPLLFLQLNDLPKNVNTQICGALDQIIGPQHSALLAREAKKPKVALRRYVLRRLCAFHDPDLLPVLRAAQKDADPEVQLYASVGLLAQKQQEGVDLVWKRAQKDWASVRELCAQVLPAGRSAEAAKLVLAVVQVPKAQPAEIAGGLRLLRSLMPPSCAGLIRSYLDAEDTIVKKEAVNAMRAIHGQAPLEDLAVFQAIEMAKEWKSKL